MFIHILLQMSCLNGKYASVAFSERNTISSTLQGRGIYPRPSPEAELFGFYPSMFGPSSLTSYLGGWTVRP